MPICAANIHRQKNGGLEFDIGPNWTKYLVIYPITELGDLGDFKINKCHEFEKSFVLMFILIFDSLVRFGLDANGSKLGA